MSAPPSPTAATAATVRVDGRAGAWRPPLAALAGALPGADLPAAARRGGFLDEQAACEEALRHLDGAGIECEAADLLDATTRSTLMGLATDHGVAVCIVDRDDDAPEPPDDLAGDATGGMLVAVLGALDYGVRAAWMDDIAPAIATATGCSPEDVLARLGALVASGAVDDGEGRLWRLRSPAAREQARASAPRAALELLADAINTTELDPTTAARARAAVLALLGESASAARHLAQSADRGRGAGHPHEAIADLVALLDLEDDRELRLAARETIARAAALVSEDLARGEWQAYLHEVEAGGEVDGATDPEGAGADDPEARLTRECRSRGLYFLHWLQPDGTDTSLLERAAALSPQTNGWAARSAALLATLGGRWDESLAHDNDALRASRRSGDRALEVSALKGIALAGSYLGRHDEVEAALTTVIETSDTVPWATWTPDAHVNLVIFLLDDLRIDRAVEWAQRLAREVDDRRALSWRADALAGLAMALLAAGRAHEAREVTETATLPETLQQSGDFGRLLALMSRATVLAEVGDLAGAARAVAAGREQMRRSAPFESFRFELDFLEARLRFLAGQHDAALALGAGLDTTEPTSLARLAQWAARSLSIAGEQEVAGATAHAIRALCHRAQSSITGAARIPLVDLCLREAQATLAAVVDDPDEAAIASLREVVTNFEAAHLPVDAARALETVAHALARSGHAAEAATTLADAQSRLVRAGVVSDLRFHREIRAATDSLLAPLPLAESELLAGVSSGVAGALTAQLRQSTVPRGHVFHHERDEGTSIHFVRRGRVALKRGSESGKKLVLGIVGPGGVLGEESVLGPSGAIATAEALEECVVDTLAADAFRTLVHEHAELGLNLARIAADRARTQATLAQAIAHLPLPQRVARTLVDLDDRHGHPTLDGNRMINVQLTQGDLAEMVAGSRQSVAEVLGEWRRDGIIDIRKRRFVVCDRPRLAHLAGE